MSVVDEEFWSKFQAFYTYLPLQRQYLVLNPIEAYLFGTSRLD